MKAHVGDAIERGARLISGGKAHEKGGLFFEPTIVADVHHEMLVMREETFGPLAAVMALNRKKRSLLPQMILISGLLRISTRVTSVVYGALLKSWNTVWLA